MSEQLMYEQPPLEFPLPPDTRRRELEDVQAQVDRLRAMVDLGERQDLAQFRGIFAEAIYCAQAKRYQELEANTARLAESSESALATIEQQRLLEVFRRNGSLPLETRLDFLLDHPEMRGIELAHADTILGKQAAVVDQQVADLLSDIAISGANMILAPPGEGRKVAYDMQDYYVAGNGSVVTRNVGPYGSRDSRHELQLPPGQRAVHGPFRTVTITKDLAYMNVDCRTICVDDTDLTFRRREVALLDLRYEQPRRFYDKFLVAASTLPSEALRSDIFQHFRKDYDDVTEQIIRGGHPLAIPISTISYVSWPARQPSYRRRQPKLFDVQSAHVDKASGELVRDTIRLFPDDAKEVVAQ